MRVQRRPVFQVVMGQIGQLRQKPLRSETVMFCMALYQKMTVMKKWMMFSQRSMVRESKHLVQCTGFFVQHPSVVHVDLGLYSPISFSYFFVHVHVISYIEIRKLINALSAFFFTLS